MKKQINEVKRMQELAGLLKEEKVIRIPMKQARDHNFNLENFQRVADQAGFFKYDGGVAGQNEGLDYDWAIEMGDDFPHALIVKNMEMLQDPEVMQFIQSWKTRARAL